MNFPAFIDITAQDNEQAGDQLPKLGAKSARATQPNAAEDRGRQGPEASQNPSEAEALFQSSPRYFYRWGRALSSTLIRLRSKFDGDFDQYLIFLVFVLSDLSRRSQPSPRGAEVGMTMNKDAGLNTLSVADITEIPRETARRKLRLLVEAGYLRREDNQLYYLGERYNPTEFLQDLSPLFQDVHS